MSRYHSDFLFSAPVQQKLFEDIHQYLLSEGYSFRSFKGENVYKKGNGFASGPTFVKVMNEGNYVIVEAWIKFAALPGVYAGELGLGPSAGAGAIPKSILKSRIKVIEDMIRHWGGQQVTSGDIKEGVDRDGVVPTSVPAESPAMYTAPIASAPKSAAYCASCGAVVSDFAAFCETCGTPVGQKKSCCPSCGQAVNPNQAFCTHCGAKLK